MGLPYCLLNSRNDKHFLANGLVVVHGSDPLACEYTS